MKKKYISLFGILLMVFAINISQAKAEDGVSGDVNVTTSVTTGSTVTPIRAEIKFRRDENKKIREDFKDDRKELREGIKEDREDMKGASESEKGLLKQDIEDKRGEIKDKKEEMKKEIRENIAMNFMKRIENLTNISNRIKIRIAKMKARGFDMAVAADFQTKADASIAQAKELTIKAKASIDAGASKEEIKANIKAVKDALKQAHTYLKDSVKEIKAKVETKTTTTTSTTVNTNQ